MKRPFEVRIVLVRTIYERNVGATSRAMSNMGVEKLIMIAPQCELTYEAQQTAATGQTGLQNRTTYQSWDEFMANEPESIKIAFTARDGKGRQVRDIDDVLADVKANAPQFQHESDEPYTVHLIFGPEDWGLAGEDLEFANHCACLPTFGENWSLNLAQATLLGMFSLRKAWGGNRTKLDGGKKRRAPQGIQGINPEQTLKTWIEEMGFDLSKQRKINAFTVLRRMLLQNTPTKKELVILETVLQQSIRKLREWKEFKNRER
ncbi:TrmH family RNA methyltransferase [Bdellovibrio sp. ZAP7]|uniref:RNA methyltransferase n=1 Tax=Bdellovibrio sp. ZAP7 TaxID=2231053 RepID=UPI0011575B7C|nr:RNA methyltransferase [Bdellovibrio sp. ZAP7]QDK46946.1 TrmH family RNA methyltransferase [Bdellovibrio sp. ZAP7]